jgi:hypothetical protein
MALVGKPDRQAQRLCHVGGIRHVQGGLGGGLLRCRKLDSLLRPPYWRAIRQASGGKHAPSSYKKGLFPKFQGNIAIKCSTCKKAHIAAL